MFNISENEVASKDCILGNAMRFTLRLSGVYCLIKDNEVVYIGTSHNMMNRIKQHRKNGFIDFKDYSLFPIIKGFNDKGLSVKDYRQRLEMSMIKAHSPKYNLNFNQDYLCGNNPLWYAYVAKGLTFKEMSKVLNITAHSISRVVRGFKIDNPNNSKAIEEYLMNYKKSE